jgi:lipopolysaccharide transport system ATP-binding protein
MNKNTAIKIQNLSKQYRLGLVGTGTLSHDLKRWWTMNVLGKEDPYLKVGDVNVRESKGQSDYVWALKDINLEIEQGDVVGIIGKNGAGKSTLLKILSRVTKPTTGTIQYRGRIASLLEVGTGFHPEMTGRENIYMNGAIMGMTRHEITRKLDEIVAFAGVERYIDTPVKRYSSGMTVRLGFAVAAHLEPDILVVDEVLAVGDAEFQKKAIGKMQDVSREGGRTVLFVSHNMAAVQKLCETGIVLQNGGIKYIGDIENAIQHYLKEVTSVKYLKNFKERKGSGRVILQGIKAFGEKENQLPQTGKLFHLEFLLLNQEKINLKSVRIDFRIDDYLGQRITWFSNVLTDSYASMPNYDKIVFMMEKLSLNDGMYYITFQLSLNNEILDWIQNAYSFDVIKGDYYATGRTTPVNQGKVLMDFNIYYK